MSVATEVSDPRSRVLLLCARLELSDAHRQALARWLPRIDDWTALFDAAQRNFLLPLLGRHLLADGIDALPLAATEDLRDRLRQNARHALQLLRVQRQLVDEVFEPGAIRHAFVKGASLAQAYYGDSALRMCRDVDVLVEATRLAEAGQRLRDRGFEVTNPAWQRFRLDDLAAFCRYHGALELRSPTGVIVELHRTLDSAGTIFSSEALLSDVPSGHAGVGHWRTLAPPALFVYLCYHHARHHWSSLHWCADIAVLRRNASFDRQAVIALARSIALEQTVDEALRLVDDLERLALDAEPVSGSATSRFLPDCLRAIEASLSGQLDPEAAHADHATDREPDFRYRWQSSARYRWRSALARWRPDENDVNAWPLPLSLHWLYFVSRPLRVVGARLFRARSADARASASETHRSPQE